MSNSSLGNAEDPESEELCQLLSENGPLQVWGSAGVLVCEGVATVCLVCSSPFIV